MIGRTRAERPGVAPVLRGDRQVVDAGESPLHQTVGAEFPVLVAIGAEPVPKIVMPFIGEPNRDAIVGEGPELLDQPVVELRAPIYAPGRR